MPNLTLMDVSRRMAPDGKVDAVVELLAQTNEILDDMVFSECNDGTNHKTTVRTGIPSGTWRKLYGGIQSTRSTTAQVVDSCGMLEALPKIDVDIVDKSGDPAGTLLSEQTPHLEGLTQDVASTLFYGDTALYPERFMGLAPRYDALDTGDDTISNYNVLSGSGSQSDNTSVWLVCWGDNSCHALYPKGSKAGISQNNLGKLLTAAQADATAGDYLAYVTHYKWDIGLSVRDWRSVGRICNIDHGNLMADSSAADLVKLMIKLSERVVGNGRRAWYMRPDVRTMLRIQMLGKANVNLTFDTVEGKRVLAFDGVPIRACSKILKTEATLS